MAVDPGIAARPCPACGAAVPGRFRACGACGRPVGDLPPVDEVRRAVTVVQSDLKGSTALGEKLDPETLREILGRYFDEMRAVFEGRGGTIEKIIGDAIVAVYGMPIQRPDDALRALEASAESQATLAALNDQLEETWGVRLTVRTGVASGEVVFGDVSSSQHVLTGETMKIGSAMEQNCPPFDVLVADSTRELVGDRVAFERMEAVTPKGSSVAIGASRLLGIVQPSAPAGDDAAAIRACSNCGDENPAEHRFCGTCGVPLVFVRARESRKTVSIVFADPKPSTADGAPPSAEAIRAVMSTYFDAMKVALERHGGTVEKFIGDAVMAVFGLPVRHEDDAVRAARAALDMQAALPALNEVFGRDWGVTLANHIGVNTGEVIAGDVTLGQRLVSGDAVNVAARLEQSAGAAEVIVGELTYRLAKDFIEVEPIAPLTLKGKAEPVPAYRLLRAKAGAERASSDSPFVGREEEMGRLAAGLDEAVEGPGARRLTVVGDAGVGKSRLIREFTTRAGERAEVLRGRCLSYGEGITYWPLGEIVREAAGVTAEDPLPVALGRLRSLALAVAIEPEEREAVVERVAAAIGLSASSFPGTDIAWAARRLLEALARRRPLVLVVDDIHWAEQTFLELLDDLRDAVTDAPLLLLCSARHELRERHEEWAEANADELIVLAPLSDADAGLFVERILGASGLDPAVVGRIAAAAEGNPLFVEQMVSMLIDQGALRREGDAWVAASAESIAVPPSITALLAARLDALPGDERRTIEPASVIGLQFASAAVSALVDEAARDGVPAHLAAMSSKQFIRPGDADSEQDYRFAHVLVKDTAYGSLLKRDRAALHERFVDWAEVVNEAVGRGQEFEEIHGYHLEQAYRYRVALGVVDDSVRAVGIRASRKLTSAGRRAMSRGDAPAAASLLRRAVGTRAEDDPDRLELVPDLGLALMEIGELDEASTALGEAAGRADELGLPALAERSRLVACYVRLYVGDADDWGAFASAEVDRALPVFETAGDEFGQTLAWRLRSGIAGMETRWLDMARAADRVIVHAERCGDAVALARASFTYANASLEGPTPVAEAIPRCEELLREVENDRLNHAQIALLVAQLRAMAGDAAGALALATEARATLEEVRAGIMGASTSLVTHRIAWLAGDLEAAERLLRADRVALEALGEAFLRLTIDGLLAKVLVERGRLDEAETVAETIRTEAGADDADAQALWRAALAGVRAGQGRLDEAVALAAEAVAIRREGQAAMDLADALERQAGVLAAAGRREEALAVYDEAAALASEKGDVVSLGRFRAARRAIGA